MTAVSSSAIKRVASPGRRRSVGLVLAVVLAALASVVAMVHSASGGRDGGLVSGATLPVAFASIDTGPSALIPRPAKSHKVALDEASVEALIDAVARKYRVSSHAMRELVGAANAEAERNGLDPLLVIAVMAVESRFNPIAQSDGGATGLMQVIPQYHADKFSATNGESVLDPRTNIKVGAQVLKEYIARGGTEAAGLQLYNGAASDATNAYANRVLAERARLREAMKRTRAHISAGLLAMG